MFPCTWHACCDFLHVVLQFVKKRKHPYFKINQWLLEMGPYHPPPPPDPAVTLLPSFSYFHPAGSQKAAGPWLRMENSQMDGAPERDPNLNIRDGPHTLRPGSHAGPANILGLQAQLNDIPAWDFGKHCKQTSPHLKCISDLLRPGQQGCPRLFLPGNSQHQPVLESERKKSPAESVAENQQGLRHWLLATGSL